MKGVIVAAGYGSRFLPITKTIPKEMLPLGTRPALDYVVEEFAGSGITEILIITSRRKKVLEDYYDREPELEAVFTAEGKTDRLAMIAPRKLNIFTVRQQRMGGTGDAVLLAREFAAGQSCVVAFPDDLHFGETPLAQQLIDVHQRTGGGVLALERIPPPEDISRYGVATVAVDSDSPQVLGLTEKPAVGTEKSRLISVGRYLLTSETFELLAEEAARPRKGEFYMTDGFQRQGELGHLWGCVYTGERLDTGEPLGYFQAVARFVLQDPVMGPPFAAFLRDQLDSV